MTRKLIAIVLAAGAMLGTWGDTYESPDGRVWTYYVYDGMATMSGVESTSGALNIPAIVTDGNMSYQVDAIAPCAFQDLTDVSSVTIPASVTSIGWGAFNGCTGLRSVSIPVSVKSIGASAFQNCASLEQVALPISLSKIEQTTFYGCSNLWRVDLPVTITSIEDNAFYGCISLSSLNVPLSVKRIAYRAFYGCSALSDLDLNEGLESIGYEAFYGCTALRTVMIPSSVTSISSYAFAACENVRSVTIPSCMVNNYSYNINNVFDNCETITSITLQEGCEAIGYSTFNSCSGLTSLTIPASVAQIDDGAFRSCTSLENITVASGNPNYKFSNGLLLTKDGTSIAAVPPGRTRVSIPDTVTSVSPSVFNDCTNLNFNWSGNGIKSIDGWIVGYNEEKLPPKLTLNGYRGIANWAFEYCSKLTNVTMGEGMTAIGASAFAECANLTSVSIPASVTTIGEDAFYQTFRLKTITLASGNRNYKYSSGLLASADNTQLVAVSRDVTSVKIPEGVTAIPDRFFAGCTKLTSVTIPASVEEIGDDGSIFAGWEEVETDDDWYYKFHGCPALKTITVATGNLYWKSINGLLLGLDEDDEDYDYYLKAVPQAMTSVSVPEGVGWISSSAFAGCSKLTSVTFPKSLAWYDGELYGYDEFDDIDETCGPYKLTSIKVAAGNEEYSSANGLLLSKDGTEIYCVPRGLTTVTIPASVTEVVPDDFEYCTKLKSFSVENGNKWFSVVNGMLLTKDGKELVCVPAALKSQRTITIPAGVTRIGRYAFYDFGQLTSVAIPEGVVEIGDGAFSGCESLAKVTLPLTLKRIGERAFGSCIFTSIRIPDSVETIGEGAFPTLEKGSCCGWWAYNTALCDTNSISGFVLVDGWLVEVQRSLEDEYSYYTEPTYTDYVNGALQDPRIRGIAGGAFKNCSGLRYVTIPSCVKYVGDYLFAGCSTLEWVDVPEGIVGIGQYAFRSCYNLSGVTIPNSVRSVAQNAFQGCSFIDRDSIPGLQLVDGWILKDDNISWYLSQDDSFNGELVISGEQGIRGVADSAFAGNGRNVCCGLSQRSGLRGVTSLIVGDGVAGIGVSAFAFCDDLTNVFIAASVKYIGEKAFYDCRGLQSVQLPDTLKGKIPDSAFARCSQSLKITYYEAPRPVHAVIFRDNYTFADDSEPSDLPQGTTSGRITKHADEDWYWTKKITVERGNAHTFYITGLTENTAIAGLDVYCDYTYKEDGETWEDCVFASECFMVTNSLGGHDIYVLLNVDDWADVPISKRSLAFTVMVYGFGADGCSNDDMSFIFGHSDGERRPVLPMAVGTENNPRNVVVGETSTPSVNATMTSCAFNEETADTYYIKLMLTSGRKYFFGIEGPSDFSIDFNDEWWSGALSVYDGWPSCHDAYEFIPHQTGQYIVKVNGSVPSMFTFYSAVLPMRAPSSHGYCDLAVGTPGCAFFPGYQNDPQVGAYDNVIDQQLFRVSGYRKGESILFRTEGADTNLIMQLYDNKGAVLASNFSMGEGSKDVSIGWTATTSYSIGNAVYLGVCQQLEEGQEPNAGEVMVCADIVDLENEMATLVAVRDSVERSPVEFDDVMPSPVRMLGASEWVNTFVIAARAGATYRIKAKREVANGLTLVANIYVVSNAGIRRRLGYSGALDPNFDGWLEFTASENGNVYIDVSVEEGMGLEYGSYTVYATIAGNGDESCGVLTVSMMGTVAETMGWKILSGPGVDPAAEVFYPAGSSVTLPPGSYTLLARTIPGFALPSETGFGTFDVVGGEVTSVIYRYSDPYDPFDDYPDTSGNDSSTNKAYEPTKLIPTAMKSVCANRTLWVDDIADWYVVSAKSGCSYHFCFAKKTGAPTMTAYGPNNWVNECEDIIFDATTDTLLIEAVESGVYYIKVSHVDNGAPVDSAYELVATTDEPGVASNDRVVTSEYDEAFLESHIIEVREVEEGRAIGELPEISRDQYRFLGWFTAPEGGEKVSATTLMGEYDVTCWAHWKDMSQIDCYGPLIIGDNVEINVELVDYAVSGLPTGLKYDAKKGKVTGAAKVAGEYEATFTKKGEEDETVMFVVREEEVSVGCAGLSGGAFTAGVAGNADGIPLEIESETGVKSVAVTKLPTGMKYDTKTELITGAPTKPGDYAVTVTVTTKSGAKRTETILISVAALPDNVVGVFNGFVKTEDGEENLGTFQLTTTDAGKLTAKVTTAAGSYSFSGTCWDKVEGDIYSATLATKKGETLTLSLDSAAGWDKSQLTGTFAAAAGQSPYPVIARKNAFGKTWCFNAEGNERDGWQLLYAENSKAAALTVTLNADGSTKVAGKLGTLSVSASGYADVTSLSEGVIIADFAPVVSVKEDKVTRKRVLSIGTNLWFDRSNDHRYIGSVYLQ